MKKLSPRVKNIAAITGLVLACIGALSLVMIRANAGEQPDAASSADNSEIVLGTPHSIVVPEINSESGTSSAFVPSSGAVASAPLTTVSKPESTPPKPTPPASSALTNKSKKPSYSSTPKASGSTSTSKAPSGGKAGQIYVPGFGWQYPTGGKAVSEPDVGGDIHKQIGIMD